MLLDLLSINIFKIQGVLNNIRPFEYLPEQDLKKYVSKVVQNHMENK